MNSLNYWIAFGKRLLSLLSRNAFPDLTERKEGLVLEKRAPFPSMYLWRLGSHLSTNDSERTHSHESLY
jgi:hypothetical protein